MSYLGAVVLHEGGGHEDVVRAARVLPRALEDGARRRRPLRPPAELHVLDVALEMQVVRHSSVQIKFLSHEF